MQGETAPAGTQALPDQTTRMLDDARGAFSRLFAGDFSAETWALLWESVGLPVVKALVLIILVFLVARWVKAGVARACARAKVEATLAKFFANLARWVILVLGGITVLQTFGVQATSFAAVVAALGFAVGLALSGTLSNVAAGVMLLVFRPFKVGDVVTVSGHTGKVDEIELFTTTLDTPDNRRIILPNGAIFGSTIENITHHAKRRVDVDVGTAYSADLDKSREALLQAAKSTPGRLEGEEVAVALVKFGPSSVDWQVRVWCRTADYFAVKDALTREVKRSLDQSGISIPFPQMDLYMRRVEG